MDRLQAIKEVLQTKLNEKDYLISTYYDLIDSNDDVDRYEEYDDFNSIMFNLTNKLDDYKANIVITMTDDGDVSNLSNVVSYDFDFSLGIQCEVSNKEEVLSKITEVIDNLSLKDVETLYVAFKSLQFSFSNPNIDMPYILNDKELVNIGVNGTCTITPFYVLTNKQLLDVEIGILSKNLETGEYTTIIDYTDVPIQSNLNAFSINPENIQTQTTGYYTDILSYRAGINGSIELRCDLQNPVCKYLFLMTKMRMDDVNVYLKVKEVIGKPDYVNSSMTIETIRVIDKIDISVTNNGIIYLTISLFTQETISYQDW